MKKLPINEVLGPKDGRKTDGKFAPGNRLGGRTKGSRNKTTLAVEELLEGEGERLTRKAIELALDGDTTALRLCLERIYPAPKDKPVSVRLPPIASAKDVVTASAKLLAETAAGNLTPSEAATLATLLEGHRRTLETAELAETIAETAARLDRLEAKGAQRR